METSQLIVTSVLIVLAVVAAVLLVVAAGRRRREKQRLEAGGHRRDAEIHVPGSEGQGASAEPAAPAVARAREQGVSAEPDREDDDARTAAADRLDPTGPDNGLSGDFGSDDTPTPPAGRPVIARDASSTGTGSPSTAEPEARTDRFLVSDLDRAAASEAGPAAQTERLPAVAASDRSGGPAPRSDEADRAAHEQAEAASAPSSPTAGAPVAAASSTADVPSADAAVAPTSGRHRARPDPDDPDDTIDHLPTAVRSGAAGMNAAADPTPSDALPHADRTEATPAGHGASAGRSAGAGSPGVDRPRANRTDAFLTEPPPVDAAPIDASSRTDAAPTDPPRTDPPRTEPPRTDPPRTAASRTDAHQAGAPAPDVPGPDRSGMRDGRRDEAGEPPSIGEARSADHASGPTRPATDNSTEPTAAIPVTEDRAGGTAGRDAGTVGRRVVLEGRGAGTGDGDRDTGPEGRRAVPGNRRTGTAGGDVTPGDRAEPIGDDVLGRSPDEVAGRRDSGDRRGPVRALADRLLGRNR